MAGEYEFSVLIVSYRPVWDKLRKTVLSAIYQSGCRLEIVVADDGSEDDCFPALEELFKENGFTDYHLVPFQQNCGTVANIKRGLEKCSGQYVKLISPGDCLYNETVLNRWLCFIKRNNSEISFGQVISYYTQKDGRQIFEQIEKPVNVWALEKSPSLFFLDYMFLRDEIIGAGFCGLCCILRKYIDIIYLKVKYSEDMMYRIMLADGVKMHYFAEPVVFYEWGEGISTGNETRWVKTIDNERETANMIVQSRWKLNHRGRSRLNLTINLIRERKTSFLKYLIYPELIYLKLCKEHKHNKKQKINISFFKRLESKGESNEGSVCQF